MGYFGKTFAREQDFMENDMFLECMQWDLLKYHLKS